VGVHLDIHSLPADIFKKQIEKEGNKKIKTTKSKENKNKSIDNLIHRLKRLLDEKEIRKAKVLN